MCIHRQPPDKQEEAAKERGCVVTTPEMTAERYDDICTDMARYQATDKMTYLDGRTTVVDQKVVCFSDEDKLNALANLYDHKRRGLNGRHTGVNLFSCYKYGFTSIGAYGTRPVKLDVAKGMFELIRDDVTKRTTHEGIVGALRAPKWCLAPEVLARSAGISSEEAEWILTKDELDRLHQRRRLMSKCKGSMPVSVFTVHVKKQFEDDIKHHGKMVDKYKHSDTLIG